LSNFESNYNKGFKKQNVVKDRLRELIRIQTCVVSLRGFLYGLEFHVLKEEFWVGRVVKKNPKNFSFTENTQLALTQALK
jgi:hypothetical protein